LGKKFLKPFLFSLALFCLFFTQRMVADHTHPRLLFNSSETNELANRRFSTHSEEWSKMLSRCNSLLNSTPETNPTNAYLLGYEVDFMALALVQLLDPSQPYLDTLTNYFFTTLNWKEWNNIGSAPLNDNLAVGITITALAEVYDLHYNNFSFSQQTNINAKIIKITDDYRNWYWRIDTKIMKSLWGNHAWNALTALAAARYAADDIPPTIFHDWTNVLNSQFARLENMWNSFAADGANDEGATYAMFGLERVQEWMEMRRIGQNLSNNFPFVNLAWFTNQSMYFMYISTPGGDDNFGGLARFGDCNPGYWHNPYSVLTLLARRLRDPVAQWLNSKQDYSTNPGVWRYLWYDPTVPIVNPESLPKWHLFEKYGLFCWRSSWSNNASYFTIKSGQHFHGHAHPDNGQFMIHRAGIPYITDSGYTVPKYTADHNVLLVNNTGQIGDGSNWGDFGAKWPNSNIWGKINTSIATGTTPDEQPDFFDILCNPTPMCSNTPITKWEREAVSVNGFFFLRDKMKAPVNVEFELRFHSFVSRKNSKPFYDYDTDRNLNPFSLLSNNWWKIDSRNENPQPPNLLLADLSAETWSNNIEETWIDDHYLDANVRLGNYLSRKRTDSESSSLIFFAFDDELSNLTVNAWSDDKAEGTHIINQSTSHKFIDILWPLNGNSCSNCVGWFVNGNMAGRKYMVSDFDNSCFYFGRETSLIKNDNATLFEANLPVSFYARIENPGFNTTNGLIIAYSATVCTGIFHCPFPPYLVLKNNMNIDFKWDANKLFLEIPAGISTFKIDVIPEPIFVSFIFIAFLNLTSLLKNTRL